ncbi:hypothetical protein GBAR_LOCUS19170 [Geodia barretti]|uniref:Double Cache domain-containing protein n=1 Tax=Geodia barretti TaxID=519541 RepID=A0AA35SQV8_GEOBA|nr:hypothetical protein GBAR_LOCUS19170 [Geodia barretti]
MALGIPAVIIAVIALAMAFNAGGDDVDDGTAESVRSVIASESAQNTRIEWLTTQVGDLQVEVADARQQEASDAAKLTADVDDLRSLASRDDRYDDTELRAAVRDNQSNLAELNSLVDNDAGNNENIIGIAASLADIRDAISDSDESTEAINTELGALRAQLMELQGAVSSGGSTELDDALSRLDWLEKAVAPSYTQAYVEEALRRYNSQGRQATLDHYSTMASVNGDLYLFVLDENYELIVHPTVPANIGMDIRGPLGTDITGKNFGAEFVTVDEQGKWVDYVYLNPADDYNYERKHSWIVRHENLIFGSGWYERDVSLEDDPSTYARSLVDRAITRYSAEGSDATIDYYNTPESVDGQWYVFILQADDLRTLANGARPELVNIDPPERIDATGYAYGEAFATVTDEGRLVSYVFVNPATDALESKHTWLMEHDGLLFGSGWYTEPAEYTKYLVNGAISRYKSDGRDATIAYYNTADSVDGQWYIYIVDEDDLVLSHAPSPSLVGTTDIKDLVGPDGYEWGKELAKATQAGHWVEYAWVNPATDAEETKRSWVIRHDGLIFGSGYYGE